MLKMQLRVMEYSKIKILIVGSFPPPYHGSAIYLDKLRKKLIQEKDLEVFVVDTSDKRDDLTNLGRFDFANVYAGLRSLFKLIYYLIFVRPDVVYIPISQNHWAYFRDGLFILISSVFKAKILIHLHGSYFLKFYEESSWLYQKFIDLTMKRVDGAIVLGEKLKYIFEKWLSTDKIFVLPNFIEWEFNEDKIRSTKNDESVVRITYLGNLHESKGIFDLLEAIKIVKKSTRTKFIVNIAGKLRDDPVTGLSLREHEIRFGNYLKELGDVANYIGEIKEEKDKFELLKNTDIFVFPSWNEGQPLVILEAMSCGCPVISTKDVGVIDETVIDGVNGLLVEKRNIRQLADAILKLVNNRDLRISFGMNSLKRFGEFYTIERHIYEFRKILIVLLFGEKLRYLKVLPVAIKLIPPRRFNDLFDLRGYTLKKFIKFLVIEGIGLSINKAKNKLIERKILKGEYLVIMKFKYDKNIFFCFTRDLGYFKPEEIMFFKSKFDDIGINSIYLSTETLDIFEHYLPVPSCPDDVKEKLVNGILKDNQYLVPFPEIYTVICRTKIESTAILSNRISLRDNGCFILGFGGYMREYALHFFKKDIIAALDYKARAIRRYFKFDFPIYDRFEDIMDEIARVKNPLVIIATYHSDHAWMTKMVLDCNPTARVFIEKPAAVTNEDANILFELRAKGAFIDIGYNRRHALFTQVIRNALKDSKGQVHITFIVKELKIPKTHWYFWSNQGTRVTGNWTHWIDLLRFLTGKNVINFSVIGDDGNATVLFELEDKILAEIIVTDIGSDFYGVEEYFEIRFNNTTIKLRDYRELEIINNFRKIRYKRMRRDKGHYKMYLTLKENILNNKGPFYPAEDILWVTHLCNEIIRVIKD